MDDLKAPRKSCDFCYQRRIKCDRAKPCCLNCVTYVMKCTYSAPSRKSRPKKQVYAGKADDDIGLMQTRLNDLETVVEKLNKRLEATEQYNEPQVLIQQHQEISIGKASLLNLAPSDVETTQFINNSVSISLPPLEHVLPIVELYLERFNTILPLFHPSTLLHLTRHQYGLPVSQRDPVAWAAINIVLALAYRNDLVEGCSTNLSVEYYKKAESVLSTIVLGEISLLNIQVLVGMVLLIQASPDLTHSLILIATTMRLVHKIGLHDRTYSSHLDPADTRQRACVFWMAYILDKDLSMRSKQPSIQLDDDVDLDLPLKGVAEYQIDENFDEDTSKALGFISTTDGTVTMNYFLVRTQLAVIEGGVYDYLYSTRSLKRNHEERSRALESIASALEVWKASIPSEFSAYMAPSAASTHALPLLAVLHSTSLACTSLINQANAWNSQWMSGVRKYAAEGVMPILPPQLESMVDEARNLSILLGALPTQNRWNFWTTGCSHMTAMMLLTFNGMKRPQHFQWSLDYQLVETGLRILEKVLEEAPNEVVRSFYDICTELHRDCQRRSTEFTAVANEIDLSAYLTSP